MAYTFNTHTLLPKFTGIITATNTNENGVSLQVATNIKDYENILFYTHELVDFNIVEYIEDTLGVEWRFIGGKYDNMYDFIAYRKYTRPSYIQKMIDWLLPLIEQVELDPEITIKDGNINICFPVTILRELVQK